MSARAHPVADRRAVPRHGAALAGRPVRGGRGHPGRDHDQRPAFDGAGDPVPDGLIETWQADPAGRFDHPDDPRGAPAGGTGFRAFGRCPTGEDGSYRIITLRPGALPSPDGGTEAPHLDVSVLARGLLDRVVTRIYFADQAAANAADPVLASIADEARRATLIAAAEPGDGTATASTSGCRATGETVFFDV